MLSRRQKQSFLIVTVIVVSLVGIFISPTGKILDKLSATLPWVSVCIVISEIMLTIGFSSMLYVSAPSLLKNMFKEKKNLIYGFFKIKDAIAKTNWSQVAKKCNESKLFWFGFWVSVVGGFGDAITAITGIFQTLPIASWSILVLPIWDILATYFVRRTIYKAVKKS